MNASELTINFIINLLSGIVGILIVLWIERQRRPSLTIKLGQAGEIKDGDPLKVCLQNGYMFKSITETCQSG